eukprot:TRINITY_DN16674_c2_g1_i2.p1 TRINITY_DN16674_c2_g1~~TRINITY_DN16674_c2_g1_i2.p1  ORF type:complete len:461 (+),score=64.70 TRINITY_DN16674_c2_g1_i2:982-2364(+)
MFRATANIKQKVKLGSAMIGGLPTTTQLTGGMPKREFSKRKEGKMSVNNPADARPKRSRVFKSQTLTDGQEQFIDQARQDLRDAGISDQMRYDAWMNDDHSVFPDRVKALNPQMRQLVKFGGLGLTQQSEIEKVIKQEKSTITKEGKAVSRLAHHDPKLLKKMSDADKKTDQAIRGAVTHLEREHDELRASFKATGALDRDTRRAEDKINAEVWMAKHQSNSEMKRREDARLQQTNALLHRKAPVTIHSVHGSGVDLSENMAVVARCILAEVPCNGNWPISIPASRRLKYNSLLNEHINEVLEGLSAAKRGQVVSMIRKNEAHQLAKSSWRAWKDGDEVGGVGTARDWKQKHAWEDVYKPKSEDDAFTPLTRDDQYAPWSPEFEKAKYSNSLHILMNTKPTADKPLSDYHSLFGRFGRQRNASRGARGRYAGSYAGSKISDFGPMPARVRAVASKQTHGY